MITGAAITTIATILIPKGLDGILSAVQKRKERKAIEERFSNAIDTHLKSINKWSSQIQCIGLRKPIDVLGRTIAISYFRTRRGDRDLKDKPDITDEHFIKKPGNYIIYGDPGSGKTTTLKRITQRLINSQSVRQKVRTPMVVRLREEECHYGLYPILSKLLGFDCEIDKGMSKTLPIKVLGKYPHEVVPRVLDNLNAILIIDGLDEIGGDSFTKIRRDLQELADSTNKAKIITTCRSGDSKKFISGFEVFEVAPLTFHQIQAIVDQSPVDSKHFFSALEKVPYSDVIDRPLLIVQLLFIFEREERLPDQPSVIYRKIIQLLLRDWDEERSIKRVSKYSSFDSDRKIEFLAAISYYLTYRCKKKSFDHSLLIDAYEDVYEQFMLPRNEAYDVAKEIESHTGIIVASGSESFEFSHLSLQEYLCANYIVRSPFSDKYSKYIEHYPAPVAIAVALSSEPNDWMIQIMSTTSTLSLFEGNWSGKEFFKRLLLERPYFKADVQLGNVFLYLLVGIDIIETEESLACLNLHGISESILGALKDYTIIKGQGSIGSLFFEAEFQEANFESEINRPEAFELSISFVEKLFTDEDKYLYWRDPMDDSRQKFYIRGSYLIYDA